MFKSDVIAKLTIVMMIAFVFGALLISGELSYQDAIAEEQINCTYYPRAFDYCQGVQVGKVER